MTTEASPLRLLPLAALAGLGVLALAGCAADGPAAVEDGSYRYLADSARTPTDATVVVEGGHLTLTTGDGQDSAALGGDAAEAELCPGGGSGAPVRLDTPLTVGTVRLTAPAVFGDCGTTTPVRITLVDLDSRSDGRPPYTRWVEFCLDSDPDCPS